MLISCILFLQSEMGEFGGRYELRHERSYVLDVGTFVNCNRILLLLIVYNKALKRNWINRVEENCQHLDLQ